MSYNKKEYNKQYREAHKEELKEYGKKYREQHKQELKEKRKTYVVNHKDQIKEYQGNYYKTNKTYLVTSQKRYHKTQNYRASVLVSTYKKEDETKTRAGFDLTQKWIIDNIFNSSCIYCGDSDWRHLGCDRIDNNLPHTPENCVCACGICNIEREGRKMSVSEFVEYRKNHPRSIDLKPKVVDINGVKVIRKP